MSFNCQTANSRKQQEEFCWKAWKKEKEDRIDQELDDMMSQYRTEMQRDDEEADKTLSDEIAAYFNAD